jgi:hypothetical protein
MRAFLCLLGFLLLLAYALPAIPADTPATPAITWKKTTIDKKFRSEGVAIADVNRDGKMDILVGDVWYEAPDWKMHPIRKVGDYSDGLSSYSECMCCWAEDINGDGWPDQIVIGFPGKPAYWYENPKGQPGAWKEHVIWPSACNETPLFVDLFGAGKRVLVMGFQPVNKLIQGPEERFRLATTEDQGQMAWFTPGKDPTQFWEMHPISPPSAPGKEQKGTRRFSHGLGVGDVNGDGRLDVICTEGWWEQPADTRRPGPPNGTYWKFHPANLGEACSDMYAFDLDGDGKADIISTSAHKFGMWWHQQRPGPNGEPTFLKNDLFTSSTFRDFFSETHALHFVDINGDGLKDLVTGKRWWSHGRNEPGSDKPAFLYWFEAKKGRDGVTTFTPHKIDDASGIGTQFTVADINGDGLPDIITANKRGVFLFEQVRNK